MKKILYIFTAVFFTVFAGCQPAQKSPSVLQNAATVAKKPLGAKTPAAPDAAIVAFPTETASVRIAGKTEVITFRTEPDVKLSLGMDFSEVKKLLEDNNIEHTCKDKLDAGYDKMTDEASAITANDREAGFSGETLTREYYLGFSANGVLSYIIWTEASDAAPEKLPLYISNEMFRRGEFPQYIACEHTDIFVFKVDGGYFTQTHLKTGNSGNVNTVNNRLTLENNAETIPDEKIPNKAYLFGDALVDRGLYGIGHEAAIRIAEEKFGKTEKDGLPQSYNYEEFAMYDEKLFYSIRWGQIVDGHSSYNGQIYVSLDGKTVLTGNFDSIQ